MVLSPAIVCDRDSRIADDRGSMFPYERRRSQTLLRSAICDPRSANKLFKSIGIIHKSRFFISTHSLRTLYNSMILPYLYYCNLARAGTYKSNLQRIVTLQKRALRIVSNSTYIAHTGPIFKELKLLKFHDIHSFQLGTFMFSFKNSTLPSKFNNFFY